MDRGFFLRSNYFLTVLGVGLMIGASLDGYYTEPVTIMGRTETEGISFGLRAHSTITSEFSHADLCRISLLRLSKGESCKAVWWITSNGANIPMSRTWNCHGTVQHAIDGSGDCNQEVHPGYGNPTRYTSPNDSDWDEIEADLGRGDIVAFIRVVGDEEHSEHSHICRGNSSEMYSANNQPVFTAGPSGPEGTWLWYECSSREYYNAINAVSPGFIDKIFVYEKPTVTPSPSPTPTSTQSERKEKRK